MSAVFSDCRSFRYRLDRSLGDGPPVAFLLHNPSTAGEEANDRTSTRGIDFARMHGFGHLTFINPWAKIATKPRDLWLASDPVGPMNDHYILQVLSEISQGGGTIIGAWGKVSAPVAMRAPARQRLQQVVQFVQQNGLKIMSFGVNLDGSPKHPLYLPKASTLSQWGYGFTS